MTGKNANATPILKLSFGPNDARDYRGEESKDLLRRLFLMDDHLEAFCRNKSVFFLIGDKGTGKTAYATYVSEFGAFDRVGYDLLLSPNDYSGFLQFARDAKLPSHDFYLVWELMLLLLLLRQLNERSDFTSTSAFAPNLAETLSAYAVFDARPNLGNVFNVLAELPRFIADAITLAQSTHKVSSDTPIRRVVSIGKALLLDAITSYRSTTANSFLLFVDGIDVRPSDMPEGFGQQDFMTTVKGLVTAVWNLNTSSLQPKGSNVRVVLLIRPEIIDQMGLQNLNAKVRDNAVVFNWFTSFRDYRKSRLFHLADGMLAKQQPDGNCAPGESWDAYFPYKELRGRTDPVQEDAFIPFLRFSFYRPRDIVTMLKLMQRELVNQGRAQGQVFDKGLMYSHLVRREYSDYLFNEVRDGLGFYFTDEVTALFKQFFDFLSGRGFKPETREFTYNVFTKAFEDLLAYVDRNQFVLPEVFGSPDKFLQALYELNVIGYLDVGVERRRVSIWSFRQKSIANVRPSVKTGTEYVLHYGMARALYPERLS